MALTNINTSDTTFMRRPSRQMFVFITGLIIFLLCYANTGILSVRNSKPIPLNVKNRLCSANFEDLRSHIGNNTELKMIYFVTPTYPRPTQIPDLTRLSHTLMHIPNLHWIVADDQQTCSEQVLNVLRLSGLPYTHLSSPKPYLYKTSDFPRGVANRRAALAWLKEHTREGILYFGDDDNTYDLRLFEEIRKTKQVGMLPVGLMGGYGVSSPVVSDGKVLVSSCARGTLCYRTIVLTTVQKPGKCVSDSCIDGSVFEVVAFYDSWPGHRSFPVDMAGFAVNIEHLPSSASMPYIEGLEEDRFLLSLGIKIENIKPLAENCSKVYVWHTKTVKYQKPEVKLDIEKLEAMSKYSAFVNLLKETVSLGMANLIPGNGTKIVKNRKTYDIISGLR